MSRTVFSLAACALLGGLLAQSWLPLGAGFLGGAILVAAAYRLRAHWQRQPAAPEMAERSALLSSGATLVCLGYFAGKLYLIGPDLDLAARSTRAMGSQLWVLIGASLLAQWIARAPEAACDERDADIASRALRSTAWVLLALQLVVLMWFSFVKDGSMAAMSAGMLVHLLIGSWMLAHVFYDLCCMRAYALTRTFAPGSA